MNDSGQDYIGRTAQGSSSACRREFIAPAEYAHDRSSCLPGIWCRCRRLKSRQIVDQERPLFAGFQRGRNRRAVLVFTILHGSARRCCLYGCIKGWTAHNHWTKIGTQLIPFRSGAVIMLGTGVRLGAGTVSLEDFSFLCRADASKVHVILDNAALDKLPDQPSSEFVAGVVADPGHETESSTLSRQAVRAIIIRRLMVILSNTGNVRKCVATYLAGLLNHDICPLLPAPVADVDVETLLHHIYFGFGGCTLVRNGKEEVLALREALEEFELVAPKLTKEELAFLSDSLVATDALCAYFYGLMSPMILLADVVGATSVDANKGSLQPYDRTFFIHDRPQKGAAEVADRFVHMMHGTQHATKTGTAARAFSAIPQLHGTLIDTVNAYRSTFANALNSQPCGTYEKIVKLSAHQYPESLLAPLGAFYESLVAIAEASNARFSRLLEISNGSGDSNSWGCESLDEIAEMIHGFLVGVESNRPVKHSHGLATPLDAFTAALRMVQTCDLVHQILATEYMAAFQQFYCEEQSVIKKRQDKEAARLAHEAEQMKLENTESNTKKKKPKKVKGPPKKRAALVLGKGVRIVRDYVMSILGLTSGEDGLSLLADLPGPTQMFSKLHVVTAPYSVDFCDFLENVLSPELKTKQKPKVPKGTRDYGPKEMAIREKAFNIIKTVFKRHGAVTIDTPVFEIKETLLGKYGEDTKLIYDLADQGGELLSLRYDLTVPFARYLASNNISNLKRYHIARVYRRDQPRMNSGRYREFYQCDFDIAGSSCPLMDDAEVLTVLVEILRELKIGQFKIKYNNRKILDAVLNICGVPDAKFKPICSAIDKLDKEPWEAVRSEMVDQKGLDPACADQIEKFIVLKGSPMKLYKEIMESNVFGNHKGAKDALEEVKTVFTYLEALGVIDYFSFDLSLARGLDYYTGSIYEAVFLDGSTNVGSIAAGGRYDNLVGMFSASDKQVPCVGCSIGIERVFTIMEAQAGENIRPTETQVLVASTGKGMDLERMRVCGKLWSNGIKAEFMSVENPKMDKQLIFALESGIPLLVTIGEDEQKEQSVRMKVLATREESLVKEVDLLDAIHAALDSSPEA